MWLIMQHDESWKKKRKRLAILGVKRKDEEAPKRDRPYTQHKCLESKEKSVRRDRVRTSGTMTTTLIPMGWQKGMHSPPESSHPGLSHLRSRDKDVAPMSEWLFNTHNRRQAVLATLAWSVKCINGLHVCPFVPLKNVSVVCMSTVCTCMWLHMFLCMTLGANVSW